MNTFKNARKNRGFLNIIRNLMSVYAKQAANLNNNSGLPNKNYAEYIFLTWFNPKINAFCFPIILFDTKNLKFNKKVNLRILVLLSSSREINSPINIDAKICF